MRLIDADAFLKEYCESYPYIYQAMSSAFKHAPKVDAVPVIRCKDCKNWCKGDGLFPTIDGVQFHACMELIVAGTKDSEALVPEFHYCSWAERKDNETD